MSCSSSKQSSASASAAASSPPGSRCSSAQRRNAARPSGPPSSCRVCIGTSTSENRRPRANSRASATTVSTDSPAARCSSASQQRRVGVQRDHRRTTGGEIERDATGAGADVENRAPGLAGQRPPQRQILAVGAALQVVPQRLEVHPRAGSSTVTASPPASRGVRVRVPSCAWVMLLTIARPRPTPACSVRIRWVPR